MQTNLDGTQTDRHRHKKKETARLTQYILNSEKKRRQTDRQTLIETHSQTRIKTKRD